MWPSFPKASSGSNFWKTRGLGRLLACMAGCSGHHNTTARVAEHGVNDFTNPSLPNPEHQKSTDRVTRLLNKPLHFARNPVADTLRYYSMPWLHLAGQLAMCSESTPPFNSLNLKPNPQTQPP